MISFTQGLILISILPIRITQKLVNMLYLQKAKSLIEKKRRARINACLEELKAIVTEHNADVSCFISSLNNDIYFVN